jgi:hypothetical protein
VPDEVRSLKFELRACPSYCNLTGCGMKFRKFYIRIFKTADESIYEQISERKVRNMK